MLKKLIAIANQYRSDVESRLSDLRADLVSDTLSWNPEDEGCSDIQEQIDHWEATLKQIDEALTVEADLEEGVRLIVTTFAFAVDGPLDGVNLDNFIDESVTVDIVDGVSGQSAQFLDDATDVTKMVVKPKE